MDLNVFTLAQTIRDNNRKLEFVYHVADGDDRNPEDGDILTFDTDEPIEAGRGKVRICLVLPKD